MSFSFYVAAPTPPDYQRVLDGLDYWDIHCIEGDRSEEGPWPDSVLHFFRDEVSTRGVEVALEEGTFQVRIMTLASPDDYELALRFVESAAVLLQQPVEPEDNEPFPVDQLRERYTEQWVRDTNTFGAATLRAIITEDESTATLSGVNRPIHVGPRLLRELDEAGPEEEFLDRLLGKLLEVQNVDPNEYYCANTMQAKRSESDEEGFTFAVWGPGVQYLMPDVQFLALVRGEEEAPVFIAAENFPDVMPDGWEWLDEKQLLVDAVDESEWDDVIARAREYEVDAFEQR